MKILFINGSPRKEGNTSIALSEVAKTLLNNGVESTILWLGNKAVHGCIACNRCNELKHCIFNDELYKQIRMELQNSSGLIIGSPVYYGGPNGSLCALLDRVFYSCSELLQYKPGASVVVCRRGGASAAFDRLNKYFTISNMPVVSSQYWNSVHGLRPGEASEDEEGIQTMRTLGNNMAWIVKNLPIHEHPKQEITKRTNFIR